MYGAGQSLGDDGFIPLPPSPGALKALNKVGAEHPVEEGDRIQENSVRRHNH